MHGKTYCVEVSPVIPKKLERLNELANDLYFSWSRSVRRLFRHLDEAAWHISEHNPKVFLRRIAQQRLEEAAEDPVLYAEYRSVLTTYDTYLEQHPHTQLDEYIDPKHDLIAYFSAEYGFHQSMPIYAGGLGILAADYCKAMSDLWVPFVGVGLLYRQGYFTQSILNEGVQLADYPYKAPTDLPVTPAMGVDGEPIKIQLEILDSLISLKIWEVRAGHIRLYLLDSDVAENQPADRSITAQLYGGDRENRIKQEMILGIGGVRALRALGLTPKMWHINEGHSAFQILERCREKTQTGLDFPTALELVAGNTVFTTHTPVPAGHDIFEPALVMKHFHSFVPQLGISEQHFLGLGENPQGGFNMTSLALRGSRFHNGVSKIHGTVAAENEAYIWPQIPADENPIGYVTNGVDVDTFLGASWVSLFDMYMGRGWRSKLTSPAYWDDFIDSIPNHAYLSAREIEKVDLLRYARSRVEVQLRRNKTPKSLIERITKYLTPQSHNVLIIGFARRFATYKRATLLFQDLNRLEHIVNDPQHPILIFFAGKAHPDDTPGQELLREVYRISMLPPFQGKIILLENYNLSMARELLPGVDVWLNTPEYPKEACGTSGMKAAINGGINLSILDGWWGEASDPDNGWSIDPHPEYDPQTRDRIEGTELLDILEQQVIPLYYQRNASGEPDAWIEKSKTSMKSVLPRFNGIRMVLDYMKGYYAPAKQQCQRLSKDSAAGAKSLAAWKTKIAAAWTNVSLRCASRPSKTSIKGEAIPLEVAVHLNGLDPEDVCVECVLGSENSLGEFIPQSSIPLMAQDKIESDETLFSTDLSTDANFSSSGGLHYYKIRIYPYHPLLSHPFEHGHMLWLTDEL